MTAAAEWIREAFTADGEPQLGRDVADALRDALQPRDPRDWDGEQMLADLSQDLAAIAARRAARDARLASDRRQGAELYQRVRRNRLGTAAALSVMTAAQLGQGVPPIGI